MVVNQRPKRDACFTKLADEVKGLVKKELFAQGGIFIIAYLVTITELLQGLNSKTFNALTTILSSSMF